MEKMTFKIKTLKNNVKILIIGDIHLGHQTNKTHYIVDSLKKYFKDNRNLFKQLSYIIINGDLFDKALLTYSIEYEQSMAWIFELVMFCSKNNIKLRLLEGTASHDNNQGRLLPNLIKQWEVDINFRYIKDIEIEYDSDFDIYNLFVPDRNDRTAKDRFKIIRKLMVDLKIDKIDFAFMHGNFNYQLPVTSEHAHDESDYLSIIRFYIVINHVHIPSVYDRILAPGSFERNNHGEEEDKGGIYIDVKSEKDMRFIFLKNNNARIFKTITINRDKSELAKIYKDIDKVAKDLPETAFLRILCKHKLEISKEVKDKYNLSGVKEEIPSKERANIRDLFSIKNNNIVELQITKDNVIDLIKEELKDIDSSYISIIEKKILKLNETI